METTTHPTRPQAPLHASSEAISALAARMRGPLLRPGDAGYEAARRLYNGMVDKHPALIARCVDVADVVAVVRFAAEQRVDLAIRGGGHSGPGLGSVENGVMLDLSPIRSVYVDPQARTARVGGGAVWGDVDHATHVFGLATPSGFISSTGVGGLTLGGGFGYLSRKYGLTIDNLLEVQLVLADGRVVTASANEYPDLFWAIRGGGGNFGVATSFVFRLHPVDTVVGGPTMWSLDDGEAVFRWYREFLPSAPEELNGFIALMTVPPAPPFPEQLHGRKVCAIMWCSLVSEDETRRLLEPMKQLPAPLLSVQHVVPYPMMQSNFDPLYPHGLQWYWRGDFVDELPDEAVARYLEFGRRLPTGHSTVHLYPVDGAVHRVSADDTAFSYRRSRWAQVIVGVDPDPANAGRITQWTKEFFDAVHPYSAGGAYVNFMMAEGDQRVQATYRDNYPRLAEVKRRYDPDNLFHVNQNIRPGAGPH